MPEIERRSPGWRSPAAADAAGGDPAADAPHAFLENWLVGRLASTGGGGQPGRWRGPDAAGHSAAQSWPSFPTGLVTERVDAPVTAAAVDSWREPALDGSHHVEPSALCPGPRTRQSCCARSSGSRSGATGAGGVEPESPLGRLAEKVPARHAVVCLPFTASGPRPLRPAGAGVAPSRIEGLSQSLARGHGTWASR